MGLASSELPVRIILAGRAPILLGDEAEDAVDAEILEKYLPTFREMGFPFEVDSDAWTELGIETDFEVKPVSKSEIARRLAEATQLMVF